MHLIGESFYAYLGFLLDSTRTTVSIRIPVVLYHIHVAAFSFMLTKHFDEDFHATFNTSFATVNFFLPRLKASLACVMRYVQVLIT